MYSTNGFTRRTLLARFNPDGGVKPNCAWYYRAKNTWFVGTSYGPVWTYIEDAWSNDTYGTWTGAPPTLVQPISLVASDDTGTAWPVAREGTNHVTRVTSGGTVKLTWLQQTLNALAGVASTLGAVCSLYRASDGTLLQQVREPSFPWTLDSLADGSYAVHIAYEGIQEGLHIPPGAVRLAIYDYTTNDGRSSHYNPDQNWGEVPMSASHPLRVLRKQLVLAGENHDVPEWAIYLTSEEPRNGEGAMLLIHVGSGLWSIASDVFVSPARPLYKLDFTTPDTSYSSPSTPIQKVLEPVAAQCTFYKKTVDGTLLLGGTRMDANGTHPAMWKWDPEAETATLLGTFIDVNRGVCEQRLSTGGVTGIEERADGRIILITLCSRHIYDPSYAYPEDRLPVYPLSTAGEPGGRSLTVLTNRVLHLTENLNYVTNDEHTKTFYNCIVDVNGGAFAYAPGTVVHLDSAMWSHQGRSYGIRADDYPTVATAKLYMSYYTGTWALNTNAYVAASLLLQRGISVNGAMMVYGWIPGTEKALAVQTYQETETVLSMDYRVRGLFSTEGTKSGYTQAVAGAHAVLDDGTLDSAWSLISMDGNVGDSTVTVVGDDTSDCISFTDLNDAGIPVSALPTYIILNTSTCTWYYSNTAPTTDTVYYELVVSDAEACYIIHGEKASSGWVTADGVLTSCATDSCDGFVLNLTTEEVTRYCPGDTTITVVGDDSSDCVWLTTLEELNITTDQMPTYLVLDPTTCTWYATNVTPSSSSVYYELVVSSDYACYVLHGTKTSTVWVAEDGTSTTCVVDSCNGFDIDINTKTVMRHCTGLLYRVMRLYASTTNPIYEFHILDCSSNQLLTARNIANSNSRVLYRVDATEAFSDLSTYVWPVELNTINTLTIQAYAHVDILVLWEVADGPVEMPIIARRT